MHISEGDVRSRIIANFVARCRKIDILRFMNTMTAQLSAKESGSSATHSAYQTLHRMIVTGDLKPGEKLKIEQLRKRLHTGASPIREALSLLTSDNLVERIDQKGFRAAPTNLANFEEILALRCALEEMALHQSLANRTDEWEEQVVLSHHRMVRAMAQSSDDFEAMHKAFHMTILSGCAGPILLKFCSQLYDLNIRYRYVAGRDLNYKQRDASTEHKAILDAIVAHDAERAATALRTHYERTGSYVAHVLQDMAVA